MIKRYIFLLIIVCQFWSNLQAQELGLYFMDGTLQSTLVNPSFFPDNKIIYSLPGVSVSFANSISSYNDMTRLNAEGVTVLNTNALLEQAADHNYFRTSMTGYSFHNVFGKKRWRVTMSHALKANSYFGYPRDLVELLAKGNAEFIGQTLDVAPDLDISIYSELAAGFMMRWDNISAGGRIKLLSGVANISTDRSSATVTTDSEYYQLNVTTDFRINAGGLFSLTGLNNDSMGVDLSFDGDALTVGGLFSRNVNLGFDLGANMKLLDGKLLVAASILDLGAIKWNTNAVNYHSQGAYEFEGLDISEELADENNTFEATLDTLGRVFEFRESSNSYSIPLPAKMFLSGKYKFNPFLSAGGLVFFERYRGITYPGVAVDVTTHLGNIFKVGLTGSQAYGSTNVGMHMALKLGPVQLIALSDNLLAVFNPFDHRYVNARFGLNLAFK